VGEKQTKPFHFGFNRFPKVAFQGSRVTSDGGLILVRELDEHLGLSQLIEQHLTDPRGRTPGCPSPICCGSRCTAGSRATKT
jgi:hypothetical protein